jgi:hypothetical protein
MIRLRQTKGADRGREFEFEQDLIRIGRMPDSDVNFDPEVDLDASGAICSSTPAVETARG